MNLSTIEQIRKSMKYNTMRDSWVFTVTIDGETVDICLRPYELDLIMILEVYHNGKQVMDGIPVKPSIAAKPNKRNWKERIKSTLGEK